MADRFLKHNPTGTIHIYRTDWAADSAFEEVADASGKPLSKKQRAAVEKIEPEDAPKLSLPPVDDAALALDAAKGL